MTRTPFAALLPPRSAQLVASVSALAIMLLGAGYALAQSSGGDAAQAPTERADVSGGGAGTGETVLATVNGQPITEADLALAPTPQGQPPVSPEQDRARRLATLIELRAIAAEAERQGLATPDFERRIRALRDQQLAGAYMQQNVGAQLTDDTLRARYETEIAKFEAPEEIRASHILVETEGEARAVIEELEGGADFAALATERSTGPSGPNGGDLGFFGPGRMVPAFDEAARALEVGAITTEPVQTQFGFHVIKVTDKRTAEAPPFDSVRDQIRAIEGREREVAEVQRLRGEAEIEILDEELRAALEPTGTEGSETGAEGSENASDGDASDGGAASNDGDASNDDASNGGDASSNSDAPTTEQ